MIFLQVYYLKKYSYDILIIYTSNIIGYVQSENIYRCDTFKNKYMNSYVLKGYTYILHISKSNSYPFSGKTFIISR